MKFKKLLLAAAIAVAGGQVAYASCGIASGNVSIIGNDFPAIQAMATGAKACATTGVTVSTNLTTEHEKLHRASLSANPARNTVSIVATSSIVPLLQDGLLRPLDDLVAKYGQNLRPSQLIKIDGKVMAIAFMSNSQHLFYRTDVLAKAGVQPPKTYEEVLAAAKAIRTAGIMQHPFALNTKTGWNLGEEFINMHLGMGGRFFKAGTAEPAINDDVGVKTLTMLKDLVAYSNPDFLTYDSNATQALWESGRVAIATMWGSRAGAILDDKGSTPEIVKATALVGAPTVGGGSTPATTLWWDGFTIAKNISNADAEASFRAMMNGLTPATVAANNDAAVWLANGYTPGAAARGVIASAQAGAKPYPMEPAMDAMHTALGDNLSAFLQGSKPARQALADVEAAYRTAAKAKGLLQ